LSEKVDISIRSENIRDQCLKLSEIMPNFERFWLSKFIGKGPKFYLYFYLYFLYIYICIFIYILNPCLWLFSSISSLDYMESLAER